MRFLVDECTGPSVARWLKQNNHNVFSVYEEARGLDDESILEKAVVENRILITIDKDFGEMIFKQGKEHKEVILLRLRDESALNKIRILNRLLNQYARKIGHDFIVATESTVRIVQSNK